MAKREKFKCIDVAIPYNWGQKKPITKWERRLVLEKGGPQCFLIPEALKFPVCNKDDFCLNCHGLLTAYRRARQYKYPKEVWMKAIELAKQAGCDWVKRTEKRLRASTLRGLTSKKKYIWKKIAPNTFIKVET